MFTKKRSLDTAGREFGPWSYDPNDNDELVHQQHQSAPVVPSSSAFTHLEVAATHGHMKQVIKSLSVERFYSDSDEAEVNKPNSRSFHRSASLINYRVSTMSVRKMAPNLHFPSLREEGLLLPGRISSRNPDCSLTRMLWHPEGIERIGRTILHHRHNLEATRKLILDRNLNRAPHVETAIVPTGLHLFPDLRFLTITHMIQSLHGLWHALRPSSIILL